MLRQFFLLLLISVLFVLLFWNLKSFLPAFLGAYTLYVLLRKPLFYLVHRRNLNPRISAALLVLGAMVVVVLPLNGLFQIISTRILNPLQQSSDWSTTIGLMIDRVESQLGWNVFSPDMLSNISNWAVLEISVLVSATLQGLVTMLIMYFILWFMLAEGEKMESVFFRWLPLKPSNVEYVKKHTIDLVYSNALGIPLMGLVQGLAGLLIYWILGIDDIWLWFVATFIAGMIPIMGVALVYVPLSLILFAKGASTQGIFMLLYGMIVMGSVDNLARMWFLNKFGHIHPLKTLFGVILGLKLFGFVGFIFGPILIALFLMLLKLYHSEFGKTE